MMPTVTVTVTVTMTVTMTVTVTVTVTMTVTVTLTLEALTCSVIHLKTSRQPPPQLGGSEASHRGKCPPGTHHIANS